MCGGTRHHCGTDRVSTGLSPRVRGNLPPPKRKKARSRPIPACAGEPLSAARGTPTYPAYPRVCGGTRSGRGFGERSTGLSPRVRGNRLVCRVRHEIPRPIPACAGEPTASSLRTSPSEAYPRVCGGTVRNHLLHSPHIGLSPRVRGNPSQLVGKARVGGPIPACAGEPRSQTAVKRTGTAYPRVCGGTPFVLLTIGMCAGLSPRVRGNPHRQRSVSNCRRPIPACAGEPLPHSVSTGQYPAYPRVCGGTCVAFSAIAVLLGLSPRVRGNLSQAEPLSTRSRPIPACAGEPT